MSSDDNDTTIRRGRGNVFEDIGFDTATADRLTCKAELVSLLYRYQRERKLSRLAFSRLVGIPQPQLSKLFNGKIDGMSTEKLLEAIAKLGGHVTIRVEPHPAAAAAGRLDMELA